MTTDKIKHILSRLEKLMYGFNYDVAFGIYMYENCYSIDDFTKKIKGDIKDLNFTGLKPKLSNINEFCEKVNYGLTFRGEGAAGLVLNKNEENQLEEEQKKYKTFIDDFINNKTKVYCYNIDRGIFWGYNFLLITENKYLFVYGFADD